METFRMIMDWVTLGLYVLWMVLAMRAYYKKQYPDMIWNMWWSLIMLILGTARW